MAKFIAETAGWQLSITFFKTGYLAGPRRIHNKFFNVGAAGQRHFVKNHRKKPNFITHFLVYMNFDKKTGSLDSKNYSIGWQGNTYKLCALPNEVLYRMLGHIEERCALYRKTLSVIVIWAVTAPGWFGFAVIMCISGKNTFASFLVAMIPSALFLTAIAWAGAYLIFSPHHLYGCKLELIEQELYRRGKGRFSHILEN